MGKLHSLFGVLLGLFLAPFAISCGSHDTVVVVSVSGAASTVQLLRVTTVLNGAAAIGSEEFPGTVTRFGLELPTLASGPLALLIDGIDALGCVVSRGQLDTQLTGSERVEVSVLLTDLTGCGGPGSPTLSVTKSGTGTGTVSSLPAGISCGMSCSAAFATGTQITLTATADANMSFGGWSGGCTGPSANQCQVTVNGPIIVSAIFTKQSTVNPPGWPQHFGGTGTDAALPVAVAVDGSGNVIVTGSFSGSINLGGARLTSAGNIDIFLAKYKPDGTHIWSQRFGQAGGDQVNSVAVDASGDIYITGAFANTVDFGGGGLVSAGSDDTFLAKYRGADGSHVWSKGFGGPSADDGATVIADSSGSVFLTGLFYASANFGGSTLTSAGYSDIILAKYKATDGSHVWSKRFGGTGIDAGSIVSVDSGGDLYVTGAYQDMVDFGGGPLTSNGGLDIYVARYKSVDGNHVWSKHFGGTDNDVPARLAVDNNGRAFVSGRFLKTVDFGGGPLISAGGYDGFVASYKTTDGSHIWSKRLGGSGDDLVNGIIPDGLGNLVITGYFQNTIDLGNGLLTSAGGYDILAARYKLTDGSHVGSRRLGGTSDDSGASVAVDGSGNAFITGYLAGTVDFGGGPLTSFGQYDAYLLKLAPP